MVGFLGSIVGSRNAGLIFRYTNESLGAIVAGLDPNPQDRILAVAGCGDQVFALLERGCHVTAVDVNQSQLDFLKRRLQGLKHNSPDFYIVPESECDLSELMEFQTRVEYFRANGRYNRIMSNSRNLEILRPMTLEEAAVRGGFTKIYASDAIGELYCEDVDANLLQVTRELSQGNLLYMANGSEMNSCGINVSRLGLELDETLSSKARDLEILHKPNIYRKK